MIVGIDPGLSGALFFLDPHDPVSGEAVDLPVHMLTRNGRHKREVDIAAFEITLEIQALIGPHVEPQPRMRARKGREQFGQAIGGEIFGDSEPHRTFMAGSGHHVARFLGERQQPPCIG